MFDEVSKIPIHARRSVALLKQRQRLIAQPMFSRQAFADLDDQIATHLYALSECPNDPEMQKSPQLSLLATSFNLNTADLIDYWIGTYEKYPEFSSELDFLVSYLANIFKLCFNEEQAIEAMQSQYNKRWAILRHLGAKCSEEPLQGHLREAIYGICKIDRITAFVLFGLEHIDKRYLHDAYQHRDFSIAYAAMTRGVLDCDNKAKNALFDRYAKSSNVAEQRDLLKLGGLTGDLQWLEICNEYCLINPQEIVELLCHFHFKYSLDLHINLMAEVTTAKQAYKAWLFITDEPLNTVNKLSLVGQNGRGGLPAPNIEHAKSCYRVIMQQTGECILGGVHFDCDAAVTQLNGVAGSIAQKRIMLTRRAKRFLLPMHSILNYKQLNCLN